MKIEDIKNKKVLLAVKNTLKNSQLRKRITCGTVAFSFVLGMSLLEGDTKKEINEEPLILEDSMVEPIIAIATSIKPKTSDYERRPVILPPIIEPVGFDEGEEEEEEEPEEPKVLPSFVPTDRPYFQEMVDTGFIYMNIGDMQNYILNTYGVDYLNLIDAITMKEGINDTAEALEIRNRADYEELKAFFEVLTDAKLNYVEQRRNESYENFVVSFATCIGESTAYKYAEGYVNMCSVDNRIIDAEWSSNGRKNTIYSIITAPGQYNVYFKGYYKTYTNIKAYPTFYGALDYLVLEDRVHDYTSFRSKGSPKGEQFAQDGNKYRTPIETRIENTNLVPMEPVNYEIVLHLLSGDVIVGNINEEENTNENDLVLALEK